MQFHSTNVRKNIGETETLFPKCVSVYWIFFFVKKIKSNASGSCWSIRVIQQVSTVVLCFAEKCDFERYFMHFPETLVLFYLQYPDFSSKNLTFSKARNDPDVCNRGKRREPRDLSPQKQSWVLEKNCCTEENKLQHFIFQNFPYGFELFLHSFH